MAANTLVVALGLATPFGDPARTQVDNALLVLGLAGLLIGLLLARTGLLPRGTGPRVAAALYALLSVVAVGLADFGRFRLVGWGIKAVAVALAGVVLWTVTRPPARTDGAARAGVGRRTG